MDTNKTGVQHDPEVLAYQFRTEKENGNGKTVAYGSPIYLGKGATDAGLVFKDVNQMVADHDAIWFLNGTLNVCKRSVGGGGGASSQRKLA